MDKNTNTNVEFTNTCNKLPCRDVSVKSHFVYQSDIPKQSQFEWAAHKYLETKLPLSI